MGELRGSDLSIVRDQLGREPTVSFSVVARCPGGHPLAIRNAPIDQAGHPFPTLFWLTCPLAVKTVARLESNGWIGRWSARAEKDEALATALAAAIAYHPTARSRATTIAQLELMESDPAPGDLGYEFNVLMLRRALDYYQWLLTQV